MRWSRWALQRRGWIFWGTGENGSHWLNARTTSLFIAFAFTALGIWPTNSAVALHEIDHRFTVEGRVCGADGQGLEGVKVIVKDTRVSVGTSGITDEEGFYKAILHLHNDNQGDPLLIKALDWEKKAKVDIDAQDIETERVITVNLGGDCLPITRVDTWVYYGLGIGLSVGAGAIGVKYFRRKVRSRERKQMGGKKRGRAR